MLELIVYPKPENKRLINNSPFCAKAEIYLNLNKIKHTVFEYTGDPAKFPNGKLPVIKHNEQIIPDSSLIQKFLDKEHKIDMDSHLSNAEKAQGFAFAKMCEEYFYWSLLHERWFIDENWKNLKEQYFNNIPALIRGPITKMIRKQAKKSAIGHGMSLHPDETVLSLGKECLKALSDFLANKPFLLGDNLSSYDATAYAFISSVLHSPLGPELRKEAESYRNLREYDTRMYERVFS
ncbi:MAG: glutathione S-transferase family protein [Oligoflexia bacterium]|nr:glutathione S-transferase family protein [Oligoflexia bacterium]